MATAAEVRAVERWFEEQGLPYFVGGHADRVEAWLSSRRIVASLLLVLAVSAAAGWTLGHHAGTQWGTTAGVLLFLVLVGGYAGGLLRMTTMVRWAVRRTFGSLGLMVPLLTRALPLLLLAVTFLFVNAEVWQVAALMPRGRLWLAVVGFAVVAVLFLLVRLPEEVRQVEHEASGEHVVGRCAGTPAEALASLATPSVPLPRFARVNLVMVLLFNQAVQVLLLALLLLAFFVAFGLLAIPDGTVEAWTGAAVTDLPSLGSRVPVSNELFQVSVFLAAFAGLYFTVYAVTDATYREQFFSSVSDELERAVAVHAAYAAARDEVTAVER
jgi:hypothetical protein